jgi:hypothetical protein
MRVIAQPAKEVKAIQRWLVAAEFSRLRIHSAATAYGQGCSIRANAERHVRNRFLLKLDFANFFPSIKEQDLSACLISAMPSRYTEAEISLIGRLVMWKPPAAESLELCIGAPSSPIISNALMYHFDEAVNAYCLIAGITYTRYADDLAFSTNRPNHLERVLDIVRDLLRTLPYPRLSLNERKLISTSKKFRRTVTGLVLSSQGAVSLGRERKRQIRSMMHRFVTGKLSAEECVRLRGILSFANDVEPSFLKSLEEHYSATSVNSARRLDP